MMSLTGTNLRISLLNLFERNLIMISYYNSNFNYLYDFVSHPTQKKKKNHHSHFT